MNVEQEKTQRWESDPTVLVVEADPEARELIGSWLESVGFQVLACPGPQAPAYVCVGGRTGSCPLIGPADVIVVDLQLGNEDAMDGTAAGELLALYTSSGKPVVAFGPDTEIARVFAPEVVIGPWPPEPYSLVKSVQDALDSRAA
jgi:CheY-like chemotaxis protein